MINNKLTYEKPHIDWWSSFELDMIEATMSGGGGGGGGVGFTYKWDQEPSISETSSDVAGLAIGTLTGIIATVATKNASIGKAIAGSVASAIAAYIIQNSIGIVYYRSYEYLLRAQPKNPNAGVGFIAGQVLVTKYYEDQMRRVPISNPSMYSNISSSLAYMEKSCPGHQLM